MPARTYASMASGMGMVSNPYPKPKDTQPLYTECETCERKIFSKDWTSHKNSKKHRQLEEAARNKENEDANGNSGASNGDWNKVDMGAGTSADGGAWGEGFTAVADAGGNSFSNGSSGNKKFSGTCYGCGQEGHSKRDCPQSGGGRGCFNCGETGHNKADCPNPRQGGGGGGGGGGSDRACFNCGQTGHSKSDCTNERVIICRNCDEVGHMSKECPKPRDYSRVKCNNCGQMGHTVKRCTQPPQEQVDGGGGWGDSGGAQASGGWDSAPAAPSGDWADAGGEQIGGGGGGDWADAPAEASSGW